MDSAYNNFPMFSQEPLLHNDQQQQQKHPRIKNLKTIIFSILLCLLIAISASMISTSMCNQKPKKPEQLDAYLSGSSQYYCHLTPYPQLCYDSMLSIITATILQFSPAPIFDSSLKIAINQLNSTTISIAKALSSSTSDSPRLSKCQALLHDSLSRVNRSLGLLESVDSNIESLTYVEMDKFRAWAVGAADSVGECFLALEEIDDVMEMVGVEEVKVGLEKANKLIANSIWLFDKRESILDDFYHPFLGVYDDYSYGYDFCYNFDYRFLICLYCVMYFVLGLLYFLFLNSN